MIIHDDKTSRRRVSPRGLLFARQRVIRQRRVDRRGHRGRRIVVQLYAGLHVAQQVQHVPIGRVVVHVLDPPGTTIACNAKVTNQFFENRGFYTDLFNWPALFIVSESSPLPERLLAKWSMMLGPSKASKSSSASKSTMGESSNTPDLLFGGDTIDWLSSAERLCGLARLDADATPMSTGFEIIGFRLLTVCLEAIRCGTFVIA